VSSRLISASSRSHFRGIKKSNEFRAQVLQHLTRVFDFSSFVVARAN
jgi:hypothetical protein